jgi:hypothetical protein
VPEVARRDAARPRAARPLPRRLAPVDDDFIRRFIASRARTGSTSSGCTIRSTTSSNLREAADAIAAGREFEAASSTARRTGETSR